RVDRDELALSVGDERRAGRGPDPCAVTTRVRLRAGVRELPVFALSVRDPDTGLVLARRRADAGPDLVREPPAVGGERVARDRDARVRADREGHRRVRAGIARDNS